MSIPTREQVEQADRTGLAAILAEADNGGRVPPEICELAENRDLELADAEKAEWAAVGGVEVSIDRGVTTADVRAAFTRKHCERRWRPSRGRGPRLGARRPHSRARRWKPGRRRSVAARSGSDSDPPGDTGEGERRALAALAGYKALTDDLVEMLAAPEARRWPLRGES
jgi:hypothetical protein